MQRHSVSLKQERLLEMFRQWAITVACCGLLFGIDQIGMLKWMRGGLEHGLVVIDRRVVVVKQFVSTPVRWLLTFRNQSERLADLEDRLAAAAVDQVLLNELQAKVTALESLSIKMPTGKKAERLAQLVDYGDRVVLAVGTRDGVAVGQIITDKEGVLVGKVRLVGTYMSEVELLSDESSKVSVQTVTGAARGIVQGRGGGKAGMIGVLQSELLSEGDVLVTTGSESGFPPGLVVGQAAILIGKPEDVTKGAEVLLLARKEGWVALW